MNKEAIRISSIDHERLGPIWVAMSPAGAVAVRLRASEEQMRRLLADRKVRVDPAELTGVLTQLRQYLAGEGRELEVAIDWSVLKPFQAEVLRLVRAIPYGETRSYQQIAKLAGNANASRAVGRANATNPMPILIPCHRVVGADGNLRGYGGAGGVETKAWLLRLEGSRLL